MRKEIHLNKKDIEQIIAEKFGENPRNVRLDVVDTCEGYGPTEMYVKTVEAVVTCQEK